QYKQRFTLNSILSSSRWTVTVRPGQATGLTAIRRRVYVRTPMRNHRHRAPASPPPTMAEHSFCTIHHARTPEAGTEEVRAGNGEWPEAERFVTDDRGRLVPSEGALTATTMEE
ncbi:hypothetical protein J6590_028922, partial [Homalodisca vitripennis]